MSHERQRYGRYYVYIVQCADGTYYTGSTNDLEKRLKIHNAGNGAKFLRDKGPVELVYMKEYRYYRNVLRAERWLKKRSREEKETLIRSYEKAGISMRAGPKISLPAVAKSRPGPIHKFGGEV